MGSATMPAATFDLRPLMDAFGGRVQRDAPLGRYTAARVGGPADALLEVTQAAELEESLGFAWASRIPYVVLGGGSNVLVSDLGFRGLVIVNRTRGVRFPEGEEPLEVWAESGVNFGRLARQAAQRGFGGLEWASGIPGTLGGAVVGNAGAHGGDMAGALILADILHPGDGEPPHHAAWTVERLEYAYRSSVLKQAQREGGILARAAVLSARLKLQRSTPEAAQATIARYVEYRRRTQPPGASMGSMFKNPPGDYAGRLIEAAGLKGARIGGAQISPLHANFFINEETAAAEDIYRLIRMAQETVADRFGVQLELEIELLGEWPR